MMLDQHHDEETLIGILEAGEAADDAHLRACEDCAETLAALRDISSALHEPDVWERRELDERPVGATISMLRAAADRLQDEVQSAGDLVAELLRLEPARAENVVLTDPRYQTAGVARKLVDATEFEIDVDPRRALDISTLAVAAAESLDEKSYSPETLAVLRGSAYRQHGVSLIYAARYPEAIQAFDRADAALKSSVAAAYEMGRVAINRTIAYSTLDRFEEAMAAARGSQRAFAEFRDVPRLAGARFAEAYVLLKLRHWDQALAIFEAIRADSMETLTEDVQARVHANIGLCHRESGRNSLAATHYYLAGRLFEQAGTRSEAARTRWHLAHLARAEGKTEEALRRFEEVAVEFAALGMVGEAATTHLDMAETLAGLGQYERVETLCRSAIQRYEISGLGYTTKALTALAYLREAAAYRRATPEVVRHVKDYLRRLPQEPALLFAPLPEPPAYQG